MVDNLTTFMCLFFLKSVNHNLLEPSGPVQACNGMALPLLQELMLEVIPNSDTSEQEHIFEWLQMS